jgi:hypothetical protein
VEPASQHAEALALERQQTLHESLLLRRAGQCIADDQPLVQVAAHAPELGPVALGEGALHRGQLALGQVDGARIGLGLLLLDCACFAPSSSSASRSTGESGRETLVGYGRLDLVSAMR